MSKHKTPAQRFIGSYTGNHKQVLQPGDVVWNTQRKQFLVCKSILCTTNGPQDPKWRVALPEEVAVVLQVRPAPVPEILPSPVTSNEEYTRFTADFEKRGLNFRDGLLACALGLGEAGEVQNIIKKAFFHHDELTVDDCLKILDELGDIEWYVYRCAARAFIRPNEIREFNISKLQLRYVNGEFTKEGSTERAISNVAIQKLKAEYREQIQVRMLEAREDLNKQIDGDMGYEAEPRAETGSHKCATASVPSAVGPIQVPMPKPRGKGANVLARNVFWWGEAQSLMSHVNGCGFAFDDTRINTINQLFYTLRDAVCDSKLTVGDVIGHWTLFVDSVKELSNREPNAAHAGVLLKVWIDRMFKRVREYEGEHA